MTSSAYHSAHTKGLVPTMVRLVALNLGFHHGVSVSVPPMPLQLEPMRPLWDEYGHRTDAQKMVDAITGQTTYNATRRRNVASPSWQRMVAERQAGREKHAKLPTAGAIIAEGLRSELQPLDFNLPDMPDPEAELRKVYDACKVPDSMIGKDREPGRMKNATLYVDGLPPLKIPDDQ